MSEKLRQWLAARAAEKSTRNGICVFLSSSAGAGVLLYSLPLQAAVPVLIPVAISWFGGLMTIITQDGNWLKLGRDEGAPK